MAEGTAHIIDRAIYHQSFASAASARWRFALSLVTEAAALFGGRRAKPLLQTIGRRTIHDWPQPATRSARGMMILKVPFVNTKSTTASKDDGTGS
jgi:hypothetical protein